MHDLSDAGTEDAGSTPRIDLFSGAAWVVFGCAVFYGSWTMDRLEHLHINPYTVPGLVPGILGAAIALCGAVMATRAVAVGALRAHEPAGAASESIFNRRVLLSMALCLAFALGLVGHGLPFWAASAIFLFVFVAAFQRFERGEAYSLRRSMPVALAVALGGSFIITMIFQEFFLVRLP